MIYSFYHWYTDTHMDENGFPWYVDVLGGLIDMLTLIGFLAALRYFQVVR